MAFTEDQYKQMLVEALGGSRSLSARQLELAWLRHADKATLDLQYQYALIQAVDFKLGVHWKDFDVATASGNSLKARQRFENLIALAKRAESAIALIEAGPVQPPAVYGAEVDEMIATLPVPTPAGWWPDPNHPQYSGDPIWRSRILP